MRHWFWFFFLFLCSAWSGVEISITTVVQLFPRVMGVGKDRSTLLAATVMIQGAVFSIVWALGPAFPAAHTTVIPFSTAWKAPMEIPLCVSTSENKGSSGAMDSDSTSTPSCIASSKAFRMSAPAHTPPSRFQQTLYIASLARGAPPLTVPKPSPL